MENQLLCNDLESFPKFYLRYIGDIFEIFDDRPIMHQIFGKAYNPAFQY